MTFKSKPQTKKNDKINKLKAQEAAVEKKFPESKPASELALERKISKATGKPYKGAK